MLHNYDHDMMDDDSDGGQGGKSLKPVRNMDEQDEKLDGSTNMSKQVVQSPEICGKTTFPVSLKQPGSRDEAIQCFIKRDKSTSTYLLYLCLSSGIHVKDLCVEKGKFLLSAKRTRRVACTEYIISTDANNFSCSSGTFMGKMRSNFLGTDFVIYDSQPQTCSPIPSGQSKCRFLKTKVSPTVPIGSYKVAQVMYEKNFLLERGPRRMNCIMYSIPNNPIGPNQTELIPHNLDGPVRTLDLPSQSWYHDINSLEATNDKEGIGRKPLVLKNKPARWHEGLQCWCLNFRGRVTVASIKNFQLIAAPEASNTLACPVKPPEASNTIECPVKPSPANAKDFLQFGKVGKDSFTMEYRYPLSAFQAFAICLTSFGSKLVCE